MSTSINNTVSKENFIPMITKGEMIEALSKFYVYLNDYDKETGTGVVACFGEYIVLVCKEKYKNIDTLNYIFRHTNDIAQDLIFTLNTLRDENIELYNSIMTYLYERLNKTLPKKEENTMKIDSKFNNPYFVYEIGDIFHNDNGEDYIIIAKNEEKDKALLVKKLDDNDRKHVKSFYIGAKGLNMYNWCHGHYFLEDVEAAFKWFNEDDKEPKGLTIEDFIKINYNWETDWFLIYDIVKSVSYKFKGIDIPRGFLRSHIVGYCVYDFFIEEEEADIPMIQINIDSEVDDIDMDVMEATFTNKHI